MNGLGGATSEAVGSIFGIHPIYADIPSQQDQARLQAEQPVQFDPLVSMLGLIKINRAQETTFEVVSSEPPVVPPADAQEDTCGPDLPDQVSDETKTPADPEELE